MAYHTGIYLFLFLPAVLGIYAATPKKFRWVAVLLSGYVFFWLISGKLLIFLIGTTIFTHYIGIWLAQLKLRCHSETEGRDRKEASYINKAYKSKEKKVLIFGVVMLLAVLCYMKYMNFFAQNLNILLQAVNSPVLFQATKLFVPIGISFYTLQAIGYMADVYWNKIPAEQHIGRVALFLGFFPQIMEGPIGMYNGTLDVLWRGESLKAVNLSQGGIRIVWGLFKKLIIADRLYVLVQAVFNNYESYNGAVLAVAAVAYTIQLYMEFSGCMDIVIGSGKLFGVTLLENFRQPFFAKNASEFWRRWHITLGAWFKAYVFYPVSVSGLVKKWNKFGRKHFGKFTVKIGITAIALFPVWLCNGLWHGPQWNYIFYGMFYFVIIMIENITEPARNKILAVCRINEQAGWFNILRILKTWVIIFTGELFFRADGVSAGLAMFTSIFKNFELRGLSETLLSFGLDQADYMVAGVGILAVMLFEIIKERKLADEYSLSKLWLPARWAVCYGLIIAVVLFGAYGAGYQQVDLIYAGF